MYLYVSKFLFYITILSVISTDVYSLPEPDLKIGFILEESSLDSVELENALEALRDLFE